MAECRPSASYLPLLLVIESASQVHEGTIRVVGLNLQELKIFREKFMVWDLKLYLLNGHVKREGKYDLYSLIGVTWSELFTYRFERKVGWLYSCLIVYVLDYRNTKVSLGSSLTVIDLDISCSYFLDCDLHFLGDFIFKDWHSNVLRGALETLLLLVFLEDPGTLFIWTCLSWW